MNENEFLLEDRLQKIRSINEQFNLLDNAYVSFSGGKDSTVLHYLLDEALPGNKIPRVYVDTYLDYKKLRNFVFSLKEKDERIKIVTHGLNIKENLEKTGYPFKSKIHSCLVNYRQQGKESDYLSFYFGKTDSYDGKGTRRCPKKLRYMYDFKDFKISDNCCLSMKEALLKKWQKENNKSIYISGIRSEEGGRRSVKSGCLIMKGKNVKSFNPLFVVNDDFENWYIRERKIQLCELYYPPFNFDRTGCKGCPFNRNLEEQLLKMENLLPEEYKQCEIMWKPVYDEYRRIGYRLHNYLLFED